MKKLKIAFLWHQHQPYYRWEDEFFLPWVRFHGIKDYFDLPALIAEYPNLKQTFNFAPSLMLQIDEYISGNVKDKVQILTTIPAALLNNEQKHNILSQFFVCNLENLIKPNRRYYELFLKAKESKNDISIFTEYDWRDLQVWYNLAWVGEISKKREKIAYLINKMENYSEDDKSVLFAEQNKILKQISEIMNKLKSNGQIDISCSPEFHPILPLLIDTNSALDAMPNLDLQGLQFNYPNDAIAQIKRGKKVYKHTFGDCPIGIWPSEGSVSNKTLDIVIDEDFQWAATDEHILKNTAKEQFYDTLKFFPQRYKSKNGKELTLLFRDHFLSDRIGFVYSNWHPQRAADEFCSHLRSIKNEIIRVHSEDSLDYAVVTVILDGENCWEFYPENGFPFLNALFSMLSDSTEFETVKCSDAINLINPNYSKVFDHIHSGSWINSNFSIWVGDNDDIKAWKMLKKVRDEVELRAAELPEDILNEVMREIYIAEGSDWFWWYGPEHNAPNKGDFDVLFRLHIQKIYELIQVVPPEDVFEPISDKAESRQYYDALSKISPSCDGTFASNDNWQSAAKFNTQGAMSAMHQVGEIAKELLIGNDENNLYFRIILSKELMPNEAIELTINNSTKISISKLGLNITSKFDSFILEKFSMIETIDLSLKLRCDCNDKLNILFETSSQGNTINYTKENAIQYKIM